MVCYLVDLVITEISTGRLLFHYIKTVDARTILYPAVWCQNGVNFSLIYMFIIMDNCPLLLTIFHSEGHNECMRFDNTIEDLLGSRIKTGILRLLYNTRGMFSGREISRQVGFSPTHTISTLRELETEGLVLRQRSGNSDLYQLNDRNAAVDGLLAPVFGWESSLLDELAGIFVERLSDKLVSIRLFGSVARGEDDTESDVDLLLTVVDGLDPDELEEDVTEISVEAGRRFGRPVSAITVTESEFARKVKSKRGLWKDIPVESKIIYQRSR